MSFVQANQILGQAFKDTLNHKNNFIVFVSEEGLFCVGRGWNFASRHKDPEFLHPWKNSGWRIHHHSWNLFPLFKVFFAFIGVSTFASVSFTRPSYYIGWHLSPKEFHCKTLLSTKSWLWKTCLDFFGNSRLLLVFFYAIIWYRGSLPAFWQNYLSTMTQSSQLKTWNLHVNIVQNNILMLTWKDLVRLTIDFVCVQWL